MDTRRDAKNRFGKVTHVDKSPHDCIDVGKSLKSSSDHQIIENRGRKSATKCSLAGSKTRGVRKSTSFEGQIKTVSFGKIQTRNFESVISSTIPEKDAEKLKNMIWYSKLELDAIASKNADFASKVDTKGGIEVVDSKKQEKMRGLECLLKNDKLTQRCRRFKEKSRKAVIHEQYRQRALGINDPNLIKSLYEANGAQTSQKVAAKIGIQDEDIATKVQQTQRKNTNLIQNMLSKLL